MAEVQPVTNSVDLTQRFVYFVQMQMQNVLLCLGLIDHPSAPKGEPDLQAAKMFIDQLEMIHEKTRGNLTKDEEKFLAGVLSELQMAFVQVAGGGTAAEAGHVHDENCRHDHGEPPAPHEVLPAAAPEPVVQDSVTGGELKEEDGDSKKRFTKSYGA